jgi:hypothetical protein
MATKLGQALMRAGAGKSQIAHLSNRNDGIDSRPVELRPKSSKAKTMRRLLIAFSAVAALGLAIPVTTGTAQAETIIVNGNHGHHYGWRNHRGTKVIIRHDRGRHYGWSRHRQHYGWSRHRHHD